MIDYYKPTNAKGVVGYVKKRKDKLTTIYSHYDTYKNLKIVFSSFKYYFRKPLLVPIEIHDKVKF